MLDRYYNTLFQNDRSDERKFIFHDSEIIYGRMDEENWIELGKNPRSLCDASLLLFCSMHEKDTGI